MNISMRDQLNGTHRAEQKDDDQILEDARGQPILRCEWCNKLGCKTPADLADHVTGCDMKPKMSPVQRRFATRNRTKKEQALCEQIKLGETVIDNLLDFKCLGHLFIADGNSVRAVDVRMADASAQFSKYTWIWKHRGISQSQKIRLYFRVVQKLVHGHEAWTLTSGKGCLINKLRLFNARCLAVMRTHSDAGRRRKGKGKEVKVKAKYGTTRVAKGKGKGTAGRWTRHWPLGSAAQTSTTAHS